MFFHVFEFHLQFCQMCKLFANKLYSINTYFYSPVWIMMVYNDFDAQNLLFNCLQISPQIFAIVQNFAMDNLRDQQFCVLLCELERLVVVLFTGNALEVEVPPGMVWFSNIFFYTYQISCPCPGPCTHPHSLWILPIISLHYGPFSKSVYCTMGHLPEASIRCCNKCGR